MLPTLGESEARTLMKKPRGSEFPGATFTITITKSYPVAPTTGKFKMPEFGPAVEPVATEITIPLMRYVVAEPPAVLLTRPETVADE